MVLSYEDRLSPELSRWPLTLQDQCRFHPSEYDDNNDDDDATAPLQLPPEVLEGLVACVGDPVTAGRLAQTNRAFHAAVTQHPSLWRALAKARWKIGPITVAVASGENYRRAYQSRHETDHRVRLLLQTMVRQMHLLPDYGLPYGWHWGSSFWKRLVLSLMDDDDDNSPAQALDGLLHMATHTTNTENTSTDDEDDQARLAALTRCMATHVLDTIHTAQIQSEWRQMIHDNDNNNNMLEQGTILLARSLIPHADLVRPDDLSAYRLQASLAQQLDALAARVQKRLAREHGATDNNNNRIDPLTAVQVTLAVTQLQGNTDDYYNVHNSSLRHVLASRRGIPITLAVVVQLVLRRLHVQVDLVGLPGHVVLGVSSRRNNNNNTRDEQRLWIDVFDRRVLTIRDCVHLVTVLRGVPWRESWLHPLSPREALHRMLNNVQHCLGRSFAARQQQRTLRTVIQLERARNLQQQLLPQQQTTTTNNNNNTVPELTLDPAIFVAHGLMDEETAARCNEASLARAFQQ